MGRYFCEKNPPVTRKPTDCPPPDLSRTSLLYSDVIMVKMASQITSLTIVYSTVYSGADQRKHKSSASLAFVRGIHRWPVNSPHKWPTRKMFPFDAVVLWKPRVVIMPTLSSLAALEVSLQQPPVPTMTTDNRRDSKILHRKQFWLNESYHELINSILK